MLRSAFASLVTAAVLALAAAAPADEPTTKPAFEVTPVAPDAAGPTSFGIWHASPESPDGRRVLYVEFSSPSAERYEERPAKLWMCDRDGTTGRFIANLAGEDNHNAAHQFWVDDEHVAFQDGVNARVLNVDTGEDVMEPIAGRLGNWAVDGKFLVASGESRNVIELIDPLTGERRPILSMDDLAHLADQMLGSDDPSDWALNHLHISPDSRHISFRLNTTRERGEQYRHLVSAAIDGSDLVLFGPKPMHNMWWDNDTIAGHDNQIDDGLPDDRSFRRWDRRANAVETLAGPGCHAGFSPDRRWLASESWYGTDPVVLKLHPLGGGGPGEPITVTDDFHTHTVWKHGVHVNPSFSRDSSRLYFNQAVGEGEFRAVFVPVPQQP